ncbi:MAG: hypothetical protein H6719_20365 [Sandaracinaceae bacterium]|nr:hypothetical protein [Sandaracinaceae bacterium]
MRTRLVAVIVPFLVASCGEAETPPAPAPPVIEDPDPNADDVVARASEIERGVVAALTGDRPGPGDDPCPIELGPPPAEGPVDPDVPDEVRASMEPFRLQEIEPGAAVATSELARSIRARVRDRWTADELAAPGYEAVLFVEERTEEGDLRSVRGRAYLYDPSAARIACAGDVEAQSSGEVVAGYAETTRTTLEVDGRPVDLGDVAPSLDREETTVRTVDRDAAIAADLRAATIRSIHAALRAVP